MIYFWYHSVPSSYVGIQACYEDIYMGNCENEGEGGSPTWKENAMEGGDVEGFLKHNPTAILGCTIDMWLCGISFHDLAGLFYCWHRHCYVSIYLLLSWGMGK